VELVHFLVAAMLAGARFLLIVFVFVPLGQTVSQQMNAAPSPLRAYSWNLLGSLAGVLAFFLVSRLRLQPPIWLGAVLLGFALLQNTRRDQLLVASLIIPLALLLHAGNGSETQILRTPCQPVPLRIVSRRSRAQPLESYGPLVSGGCSSKYL
jgi:hypothetical protein